MLNQLSISYLRDYCLLPRFRLLSWWPLFDWIAHLICRAGQGYGWFFGSEIEQAINGNVMAVVVRDKVMINLSKLTGVSISQLVSDIEERVVPQ